MHSIYIPCYCQTQWPRGHTGCVPAFEELNCTWHVFLTCLMQRPARSSVELVGWIFHQKSKFEIQIIKAIDWYSKGRWVNTCANETLFFHCFFLRWKMNHKLTMHTYTDTCMCVTHGAIFACMHVYVYVYVYVSIYLSIYLSMCVRTYACLSVCMHACVYVSLFICMHGCMHGWIDGCM